MTAFLDRYRRGAFVLLASSRALPSRVRPPEEQFAVAVCPTRVVAPFTDFAASSH